MKKYLKPLFTHSRLKQHSLYEIIQEDKRTKFPFQIKDAFQIKDDSGATDWWRRDMFQIVYDNPLWRVLNENIIDDDTFTCIQPTSKGKTSDL